MKKHDLQKHEFFEMSSMTILNDTIMTEYIAMGHRICDNCGRDKDTSGAKTCSNGHFICHHCAAQHIHCPLCKHTLR